MKIGHLEPKPLPGTGAAERKAQAAPQAVAGSEAGTTVDLAASTALRAGVAAEPTFDAAKVERIAQAIRDGKFEVNAGAIADKLIANAQELLSRGR